MWSMLSAPCVTCVRSLQSESGSRLEQHYHNTGEPFRYWEHREPCNSVWAVLASLTCKATWCQAFLQVCCLHQQKHLLTDSYTSPRECWPDLERGFKWAEGQTPEAVQQGNQHQQLCCWIRSRRHVAGPQHIRYLRLTLHEGDCETSRPELCQPV